LLEKSQPGHLSTRGTLSDNVKSKAVPAPQLTLKGDRNSVDIDKEMANLSENSLMYNALAQILSKKFQGLKNVIQEGRK
jgi:flagellar basal-body rod protein FlgB